MSEALEDLNGRIAGVSQPPGSPRLRLAWSKHAYACGRRRLKWLQWLPVAAALVYAVGFLVNCGAILHSIYDVSDWTGLMYMTQALPSAPHNTGIVMADLYMLDAFSFLIATRWIPGHMFIWEIAPWVVGAIASGVLARSVGAVHGRWAGWTSFTLLVCAGPVLLQSQFEWDGHATAQETICVLGAAATLLPLRGGVLGRSRWSWWGWLLVLAVLSGGGIVDDPLFILGGLVPLVVSGLVTAWLAQGRVRHRILSSVGCVTVGGGVFGLAFRVIAVHERVTHTSKPVTLVAYNSILDHVGLAAQSLLEQLNGNFGSETIKLTGLVNLLAAAVVAAAVYVVYRLARRHAHLLLAHATLASGAQLDERGLARVGLVVYWVTGSAVVLISFIFTSAVVDITGQRYVLTVSYAVIVLAAAALSQRPRGRLAAGVGASIVVFSAALAIWQKGVQQEVVGFPGHSDAAVLDRWAKSEHLTYGFASYWDAYPVSWWSDSKLSVYPVTGCGPVVAGHPPETLCAYNQLLTSWYRPRPHTRSFVAVDTNFLTYSPSSLLGVSGAPPGLGPASQVAHVGRWLIFVYPYDVASRFGPSANN